MVDRVDSPSRGLPWLLAVLALTAAVLWSSLAGGFVYDDLHLARANPALAGPAELARWLGRPYWGFVEGEVEAGVGYWRPLSTLALYSGHVLGGGGPLGHHAVSLALHLAATAFAFRLILGLARSPAAAAVGAALFGLHPVQVESVAWISAVGDPLAGAAVLFGLGAFHRYRARGSHGQPFATALALAIGLLAKESALALVPLAAALDSTTSPKGARARGWFLLGLVVAAWWAVRAAVFHSPWAGFDQVSSHLFVPAARELTLRVELLGGALALLVFPRSLNLFREVRPEVPAVDPTLLASGAAIAIWAACLVLALAKRRRVVSFALLAVPAALAPALVSFDSIGRFPLSDRFLYVAVLAPALMLALLTRALELRAPVPAWALPAVAVLGLAGLKSHARVPVWRDELTLFRDAVAKSPKSAYVRWGLGRVLLEEFQRTGDLTTLREAKGAFETAQDLTSPPDGSTPDPSVLVTPYDQLQASLGIAWYYLLCARAIPEDCTADEAALVFEELAKRTEDTPYRLSRGRALTGLGLARSFGNRTDEADQLLREAAALAPELAEAWYALAELARARADWPAAEEAYRAALERSPDDPETLAGLGEVLIAQGRADEGRALVERARAGASASSPEGPARAEVQLGLLAGQEGRFEAALTHFERALELAPDHGPAHVNRGKALLRLGRTNEAAEAFQNACRAAPQSFEAHYNLGVLLYGAGLEAEGEGHLRAALSIEPEHGLAEQIRALLQGS